MSVRPRQPVLSAGPRARFLLAAVMAAFAALAGVGCACVPAVAERQVIVTLSDDLVGKPVVVSLHGATDDEVGIWRTYSVEDYFSPANQLRAGIAKEGELAFDTSAPQRSLTLDGTDPAWQRWKERNALQLVVMAYVPGFSEAVTDKAADPRRQIVPLSQCRWERPGDPIRIRVASTGVTVESEPLPETK